MPASITGCILARNEEKRIEDALKSLRDWCDQIIVLDNESTDATRAIAAPYSDLLLTVSQSESGTNFDAVRNQAIEHATSDWIFYLDADERVPALLGQALRKLVEERGNEFEALCIPFKHYFCGKWMEHSGWWPGYTRPQLLKKGRFRYNERLHSGVSVDGRTLYFPADNADYAIVHYSYDDLSHYLTKLNAYTDGEAESLYSDHHAHSWQAHLAHFVVDWHGYYERGRADLDGMHGFILSFFSAFYRFASRAKLWDIRRQKGEVIGTDAVPTSVDEMLTFMNRMAEEGPASWLAPSSLYVNFQGDRIPTNWLSPGTNMPVSNRLFSEHQSTDKVGITACIIARNEGHRIKAALESLQGWTDRIIVVDNESEDATGEIARQYTPFVISSPRAANFEAVRLQAAVEIESLAFEIGDWLFYLDADERVSPDLGEVIRRLVAEKGDDFDAICFPFRNRFYGKWMQSGAWWPGYKGPQLLKRGVYRYGAAIHSGTHTDGRLLYFPNQDPSLSIEHEAYDSVTHYLTKLNAYTTAQAEVFDDHRESHSWHAQLAHFVHDWKTHYDDGNASVDGMHGFLQSFLCAFYSFAVRAKLWDRRRIHGETHPQEPVPASIKEMLGFMSLVLREGPGRWLSPRYYPLSLRDIQEGTPVLRTPLVWHGPLLDPSGYAADGRNLVLSALSVGERIVIAPQPWGNEDAGIASEDRTVLNRCLGPVDLPTDIFVSNTLPRLLQAPPNALYHIARTVFETDRLPRGWEQILNRVDRLWVPSQHSRDAFLKGGVLPEKIAIIPEVVEPTFLVHDMEPWPVPGNHTFTFLSVFDWALHKGWDVLLTAFGRTFGDRPDVGLLIKTWSSNGYNFAQIQEQADTLLRSRLNKRLSDFPNIHLWQEQIPATEMPRLYRAADCFVLPTRAEGWCRPLMEAMATGLPTIATAWGGHTDYHDSEVGYPIRHTVQEVSEVGAREIPFFAGHFWSEPDIGHLQKLLRYVVSHPEARRKKGEASRKRITARYSREAVGKLLQQELADCRNAIGQTTFPQNAQHATPVTNDAILIQCASGDQTAFLDLTREHHAAYAQARGMDYVCRYGPQQTERKSNWDKILLILTALRTGTYKHIIWLDADTLIVEAATDLRQALPPQAWLGMVRHANPGRGEHVWYNSGAIYLRNTPECLAYFEEVWRTWPVNHDWEDNMAMILVLGFAPERWTGVTVLGDEWNSTRLMNEVSHPVVKAWHGNGSVAERLSLMQEEMQARKFLPATQSREKNVHRVDSKPSPERAIPSRLPANPVPIDPIPNVDFGAILGRPLRIRWEGDQFIRSSLALVNREMCLGLLARTDVELSLFARSNPWHTLTAQDDPRFAALLERLDAPLSGPPDIVIRHHFPPNWSRPEAGKLIVIQPWEMSYLPEQEWIDGARTNADAVWAYSRFVRDTYVRSGVPAERVSVVPLGVRPSVFTPEGPTALPRAWQAKLSPAQKEAFTRSQTRFLFVGGTTIRKGADLLLTAYRETFAATDPVCLVIKDMGTKTFYQGENMEKTVHSLQQDPLVPPILYFDDDLSDEEMAALYRACTCVVLPYRGEGFGLAPLEGMACGRPAIVTAGGASEDYLDDSTALRVPSRRRLLPGFYKGDGASPFDPWDLEPDAQALRDALRWVHQRPEDTVTRGQAAQLHVASGWGWERAVQVACSRLMNFLETPGSSIPAKAKVWFDPISKKKGGKKRDTDKVGLSLCMIVRNEEERLAKALDSIASHVDEMIVVDTGSTDNTREIARDCGARVFDFPWTDSFAEARNQSLMQARGEWIFWMDADDVISPECGNQLRQLMTLHPNRDAAYQVQVRIPPGPGEFSATVVDHVKLFPNLPEVRFEHRIHEQILPALRRAGISIHFSDLYVTHAHYDRSPAGQARKRQRDFHLLERDLRENPNHPFVLFNLGMTHLYATKEFEIAAHYLRRCLDGSDWRDSIVRKTYALLTTARMCQMEWRTAIAMNKEGRSYYPDDAELLFQAGQLYQQEGWFEEARRTLERLVQGQDDPHYRSVDVGLRTYRGWHELALLYGRMGDIHHCQSVLQRIVDQYPHYSLAQEDLMRTRSMIESQGQTRSSAFANSGNVLKGNRPTHRDSIEVTLRPHQVTTVTA